MIEFALIFPFLAILVFGVVDLGRAWQLQSRLSNAAREGAASIQFAPKNVDSGCAAGNNATDRAEQEEPDLPSMDGYAVSTSKVVGSTLTPYTGCGTTNPVVTLGAGERVRVTVRADFEVVTPLIGGLVGDPITIRRTSEVVVQG